MEIREGAGVQDKRASSPTTGSAFGQPAAPLGRGPRPGGGPGAGRSSARAVGSFVPRLTRKAMEKYGFSAAALLTDWAQIVGADLARYTEPQRLKWPRAVDAYGETDGEAAGRPGAILHLSVDGARALDVQYKGRQIIERINAYFGYRAVAELRISQAHMIQSSQSNVPPRLPREVIGPRAQATRPMPDLAGIGDDGLRAALEKLQRGIASR